MDIQKDEAISTEAAQPELWWELINKAMHEAQVALNFVGNVNETYSAEINHIENNSYLTEEEKEKAKLSVTKDKDIENLLRLKGPVYPCDQCGRLGYTIENCEHCLKDSLRKEFSNWSSGNPTIDNAIRESQMALPLPEHIIEWIPHDDLTDIQYKTKGGFASIYLATWEKGSIISFDKKNLTFERDGTEYVVLKRLNGSNNSDMKFLDEVKIIVKRKCVKLIPSNCILFILYFSCKLI